ncbi:MAG: hypothetical protein RI953_1340 [Pseudomonadota bacterium]
MNMKIENMRKEYFPHKLSEDCEIIATDKTTMRKFLTANFERVFPKRDSTGTPQTMLVPEARAKAIAELQESTGYNALHQEHFLFMFKGEPIGWSTGETQDFMTYYMRNSGILPEHQKLGLYSKFLDHFSKYIERIGYERLTSQHKADNSEMLITKLKAGFVITGMDLDERWGALVRLTKFLKPDRESAFGRCFGRG